MTHPDKLVKECSALPPATIIKKTSQASSVLVPTWLDDEWSLWKNGTGNDDDILLDIGRAVFDTHKMLNRVRFTA